MAARKIRNEVALQDDLPCRGLRRFRLWMDVVGAPAKVDAEKDGSTTSRSQRRRGPSTSRR